MLNVPAVLFFFFKASENQTPWNIFLEMLPADSPAKELSPADRGRGTLVFFKLYDPKDRRLYYKGYHIMGEAETWKDLFPMLNDRAGYPRDTPLMLFEEVKPSAVERIEDAFLSTSKAGQEERTDGDIIVYQKADKEYLAAFPDAPTAKDFYK
jgi:ubiquitin carboxyl-terminal hydrolase 7